MAFIVCNTTVSPLGDGSCRFQDEGAQLPNEKLDQQEHRKKGTRRLVIWLWSRDIYAQADRQGRITK